MDSGIRAGRPARPGEVLVAAPSAGGYDPETGFDPAVTRPVPNCEPMPLRPSARTGTDPASGGEDGFGQESSSTGQPGWLGLDQHSHDVREHAAGPLDATRPRPARRGAQTPSSSPDSCTTLGKAHPTWQDALCALADDNDRDRIEAGRPWAKSGSDRNLNFPRSQTFRHELASLLMLDGPLRDLLDTTTVTRPRPLPGARPPRQAPAPGPRPRRHRPTRPSSACATARWWPYPESSAGLPGELVVDAGPVQPRRRPVLDPHRARPARPVRPVRPGLPGDARPHRRLAGQRPHGNRDRSGGDMTAPAAAGTAPEAARQSTSPASAWSGSSASRPTRRHRRLDARRAGHRPPPSPTSPPGWPSSTCPPRCSARGTKAAASAPRTRNRCARWSRLLAHPSRRGSAACRSRARPRCSSRERCREAGRGQEQPGPGVPQPLPGRAAAVDRRRGRARRRGHAVPAAARHRRQRRPPGLLHQLPPAPAGRLDPARPPRSLGRARDLLAGTETEQLSGAAIGQFDPAGAGGPGSSRFGAADPLVNPWGYVLLVEGALLFAASAARRNQHAAGRAAVPFTVAASPDGSDSGAAARSHAARCGRRVWSRALHPGEIRQLFAEARASWRGRPARRAARLLRGHPDPGRRPRHRQFTAVRPAAPQRPRLRRGPARPHRGPRATRRAAGRRAWRTGARCERAKSTAVTRRCAGAGARNWPSSATADRCAWRTCSPRSPPWRWRSAAAAGPATNVPVRVPPPARDFLDVLAEANCPELRVAVGLASCLTRAGADRTRQPQRSMRQVLLPVDPLRRWRDAPARPRLRHPPAAGRARRRADLAQPDRRRRAGRPAFRGSRPSGTALPSPQRTCTPSLSRDTSTRLHSICGCVPAWR